MNKNKFKAQALAIVMVVLVVASIIGIALFSRMSKDRQSAIDEQNSAVAAELADGVLDVLVNTDIDTLESFADKPEAQISSLGTFETFLTNQLGIDVPTDFPDDSSWCPPEANSTFNFSLVTLGPDEPVEVVPGSIISYHIQGATISGSPCNLQLSFETVENNATFLFKKVFEDSTSDVAENYCVRSATSPGCTNSDIVDYGNITDLGVAHTETIDLSESGLAEIRVIPIKGTVSVGTLVDESCIDRQFYFVKAVAEANCNGSYRAKEMKIPGSGNLGYSALFDYAIYDRGQFRLKH